MCVESDHSSTVIEAYLKALKRRRYSPKTIATYRHPLTLFASFLAARAACLRAPHRQVARLQNVGRDDLAAWRLDLVERGLADASLEVFLRAVRNLFNWMEAEGMLRKYGRKAKLSVNITPHSLRRACATHMLRNGAHPVQIQMLLGHATMRHLAQYLRLTIREIREMHRKSRPGQ